MKWSLLALALMFHAVGLRAQEAITVLTREHLADDARMEKIHEAINRTSEIGPDLRKFTLLTKVPEMGPHWWLAKTYDRRKGHRFVEIPGEGQVQYPLVADKARSSTYAVQLPPGVTHMATMSGLEVWAHAVPVKQRPKGTPKAVKSCYAPSPQWFATLADLRKALEEGNVLEGTLKEANPTSGRCNQCTGFGKISAFGSKAADRKKTCPQCKGSGKAKIEIKRRTVSIVLKRG